MRRDPAGFSEGIVVNTEELVGRGARKGTEGLCVQRGMESLLPSYRPGIND